MLPTAVRLLDRGIALTSGRRYPAYQREAAAMERLDPEAIAAWQRRRLSSLLDHAMRHVPYWREALAPLGATGEELAQPGAFERVPFLTKDLFREQGEALVDERGTKGRVTRSSTGGSTGKNIWFLIDLETHDRRRAVARLTDAWEGVAPGTRIATLWGSPLDANPSRKSRTYDRLSNRMMLSAYGVDEGIAKQHLARLRAFRPEAILSYPSILSHFARGLGRDACRALGVRRIFTSAEALYPSVRAELEDLFGCPVRNRYASREFGMIAAQCPESNDLHLMDPRFVVENVESGDGTPELVITDLDNRLQPFIRYRIHDCARLLPGRCACGRGFSRIAALEGRALDVVVTPAGRAFGGTFFTLVLRPEDRSVEQFQVVQEARDRLRVSVVRGPGWTDAHEGRLVGKLERHLEGIRCRIEVVDAIPPLASGKHRFVVGLPDTPAS